MRKNDSKQSANNALHTYIVGFIASLGLSCIAYYIATRSSLGRMAVITLIVELALIQFCVQAYCFLHVGQESKPRWHFSAFVFMILVVSIVVLGSIWIMDNLNYHMHSSHNNDSYIIHDEGFSR